MGKASKNVKATKAAKPKPDDQTSKPKQVSALTSKEVIAKNLPPIGLVFTVIACSGFLFVFSFRDVFATGRVIGGSSDEALLVSGDYYWSCQHTYFFLHRTRSFRKQRTSLMTRKDGSQRRVD